MEVINLNEATIIKLHTNITWMVNTRMHPVNSNLSQLKSEKITRVGKKQMLSKTIMITSLFSFSFFYNIGNLSKEEPFGLISRQ